MSISTRKRRSREEWSDLKLIIEGIDPRSVRHFKRYRHRNWEHAYQSH